MKISACVITKNEERNLPLWLDSMKRLADELNVVDTGSEDRTVEAAREGGAKVFSFPWIDDFAAAKNFALEKASGEWILFLDADEYFPREDCPKVKSVLGEYDEEHKVVGFAFCVVNIDKDTGRHLGGTCAELRCFRNRPWLRYAGRIHEQLVDVSEEERHAEKVIQYVPDITVYHTGYTQSLMEEKSKRNLRLLEKLREEGRGRDEDFIYLADAYYGLGEYEKAIEASKEAIRRKVEAMGLTNRPHTILIQSLLMAGHSPREVREALACAVERYPRMPEYHLFWGLFAWDCREYDEAEAHFLKGFDLRHIADIRGSKDAMLEDNSLDLLPGAYFYMGEISRRKGHLQEAAHYYSETLKMSPDNAKAMQAYREVMREGWAE